MTTEFCIIVLIIIHSNTKRPALLKALKITFLSRQNINIIPLIAFIILYQEIQVIDCIKILN